MHSVSLQMTIAMVRVMAEPKTGSGLIPVAWLTLCVVKCAPHLPYPHLPCRRVETRWRSTSSWQSGRRAPRRRPGTFRAPGTPGPARSATSPTIGREMDHTPLPDLFLYGRPGCHLCDDSRALVTAILDERRRRRAAGAGDRRARHHDRSRVGTRVLHDDPGARARRSPPRARTERRQDPPAARRRPRRADAATRPTPRTPDR